MASVSILPSSSVILASRRVLSASLTFSAGLGRSSIRSQCPTSARSPLLHCSFCPAPSSLSFPSSIAGSSLGLSFDSSGGTSVGKRRGLVVRAGKAALCQTKRNRSRKSLARTHGFRRRMRTTSGRALLKRRRAKGRWVLCPKSYPKSGKGA
ncbi:hypothetical protein SAY87_009337 [Trapa incisa]|uniref:Large ribosomal subunit protein bL34c n=1 Tax=Trapa incisa TaxID=236973 RepID=A0AAN7JUU0_9MYRT|nr:hypothetical protein SAY87_009337 [Trapa incisa]